MKCAYKGCKEMAIYVLIDGYLSGTEIWRSEISAYPLCESHDELFHCSFGAKSRKRLAKSIEISEDD